MDFSYEKLEVAKKLRNGKPYFTFVEKAQNNDRSSFLTYNKSLGEGREEANNIINAYRNPANANHAAAYDAYKNAYFNEGELVDACTEKAMKKNGARKHEMRNTQYENKVVNALPAVTSDDRAAVNAFRETIQDVFNAVGYEHWTPADVADKVFDKYPISNKEKSLNILTNMFNAHFPQHSKLKKSETAARKKNQEETDVDGKPIDPKKANTKNFSNMANRMAELRGEKI